MQPNNNARLVWIEAFIAVCDEGSWASASRKLKVDESSIRDYVRGLEVWLDIQLFFRKPSLLITPDGIDFLKTSRKIMKLIYSFQEKDSFTSLMRAKGLDPRESIGIPIVNKVTGQTKFEID